MHRISNPGMEFCYPLLISLVQCSGEGPGVTAWPPSLIRLVLLDGLDLCSHLFGRSSSSYSIHGSSASCAEVQMISRSSVPIFTGRIVWWSTQAVSSQLYYQTYRLPSP